jgi:hypothetical protein
MRDWNTVGHRAPGPIWAAGPRLGRDIYNLATIGTPHHGAWLAPSPTLDPKDCRRSLQMALTTTPSSPTWTCRDLGAAAANAYICVGKGSPRRSARPPDRPKMPFVNRSLPRSPCTAHPTQFIFTRRLTVIRRRGGRVAEGNGLLNRRRGNSTAGSNPVPSAITFPA